MIEPAAGADRATLAFLVDAYDEDEIEGETRTVLRLHPQLAPVKVAVLPLVRKDGQPELAREIYERPARADAGRVRRGRRDRPPLPPPGRDRHALVRHVDHQSLEDRTVTVRDRDSLAQERIAIDELADELERRLRAPWRSLTERRVSSEGRTSPSRDWDRAPGREVRPRPFYAPLPLKALKARLPARRRHCRRWRTCCFRHRRTRLR